MIVGNSVRCVGEPADAVVHHSEGLHDLDGLPCCELESEGTQRAFGQVSVGAGDALR